ncbi:hypothetical protein SCA6_020023 [Theobroma cacao]
MADLPHPSHSSVRAGLLHLFCLI